MFVPWYVSQQEYGSTNAPPEDEQSILYESPVLPRTKIILYMVIPPSLYYRNSQMLS